MLFHALQKLPQGTLVHQTHLQKLKDIVSHLNSITEEPKVIHLQKFLNNSIFFTKQSLHHLFPNVYMLLYSKSNDTETPESNFFIFHLH